MEKKFENVELTALTIEEQTQINGGGEVRENEKQKNLFDLVWALVTG